jgi:hypothetical protein
MAAALVVGMVACCNRHDTDALAACYAADARVHPAGWPQAVDARTRLATFGVILATSPTCGSIRATWLPRPGGAPPRTGTARCAGASGRCGYQRSDLAKPALRSSRPALRAAAAGGRPRPAAPLGQGHPRQTLDTKR